MLSVAVAFIVAMHVINVSFHQACALVYSCEPFCGVHRIDITCCLK